ncbi:hypothetical protein Tco_1453741, partial [Tanacetum coccineum]
LRGDGLEEADGNANNETKEISQEDRKESRNKKITRRIVPVKETTVAKALVAQDGFSSSSLDTKVSTCSKACIESVEARLDVHKKNEAVFEEDIKILKLDIMLRDNALTELRKKFEKVEKERVDLKLTLEKFENLSKNLSKLLDGQVSDKFKTGVDSQSPRSNKRNWNNLMTQKLRSNFEFKNKASYVCGSFNHLIKDCDFYEKKMVEKPVWNNARRVNHQNSQRMSHLHPKRNFVPKAVLMKSSLKTLNTARQNSSRAAVSVNTARPINTAYTRPTVNCARPASNVFNRAHSHVRRPFNEFTTNKNSNFNEKVNTVKGNVTTVGPKAVVSDNKGNEANAVKASACWVWRPKQKVLDHGNPQQDLKDKGVIDSGCSRHMTGNRSYLTDYEEIDGGFFAFGANSKGGKITRKGKIRTGKLDFEDVYFVKEIKFNLFSVSQMCDKKNSY